MSLKTKTIRTSVAPAWRRGFLAAAALGLAAAKRLEEIAGTEK